MKRRDTRGDTGGLVDVLLSATPEIDVKRTSRPSWFGAGSTPQATRRAGAARSFSISLSATPRNTVTGARGGWSLAPAPHASGSGSSARVSAATDSGSAVDASAEESADEQLSGKEKQAREATDAAATQEDDRIRNTFARAMVDAAKRDEERRQSQSQPQSRSESQRECEADRSGMSSAGRQRRAVRCAERAKRIEVSVHEAVGVGTRVVAPRVVASLHSEGVASTRVAARPVVTQTRGVFAPSLPALWPAPFNKVEDKSEYADGGKETQPLSSKSRSLTRQSSRDYVRDTPFVMIVGNPPAFQLAAAPTSSTSCTEESSAADSADDVGPGANALNSARNRSPSSGGSSASADSIGRRTFEAMSSPARHAVSEEAWIEQVSNTSGRMYWWNPILGKSQWRLDASRNQREWKAGSSRMQGICVRDDETPRAPHEPPSLSPALQRAYNTATVAQSEAHAREARVARAAQDARAYLACVSGDDEGLSKLPNGWEGGKEMEWARGVGSNSRTPSPAGFAIAPSVILAEGSKPIPRGELGGVGAAFSPHLLAAAAAASGAATAATNGTFPHTVPRQGDKCALQVSPRVLAAAVVAEGSQARIRSIRESRVPLQEALYCSGGARGSSSAECGVRPSHVSRSTKSRSLESTFARGGVSQRDSHVSYNEATNDLDEYMESVESDADIGELADDSSMYDTNIGALTDDSSMFVSFTDSNASVNSLSWTSGSAKQLELAARIRSATLQQQSRAWDHHSSAPPGAFVTAATSPPLSENSDSVSEAEDDRALERERLRRVSIAQLIRNCAIKASSAASPARESSPTLSPSELCPPSLVRDKQSKKKTKKKEEENTVTITKTKTSRSKETRQQFNRRRSIEHMLRGSATSKKKSPASDSSPNDVSAAKATGREAEKLRRYARRRAKMQQSNARAMHVAALPQKGPRLAHISAKSKSESDEKVKAKAKLTSTSMASLSMTKGPQSSSDAELLHDSDRRVRIRSSSIPGVAGPGLDALLPTVVLLDKNAFSLTITAMLLDRVEGMNHVDVARSDEVVALALSPHGQAIRLIIIALNIDNEFDTALLATIRALPRFKSIAIVGIAEIDSPYNTPRQDLRHTKGLFLKHGFDDIIGKPPTEDAMIGLAALFIRND